MSKASELLTSLKNQNEAARTFVATYKGTLVDIKGFTKEDDANTIGEDIYSAIGETAKSLEKSTKKKIAKIMIILK